MAFGFLAAARGNVFAATQTLVTWQTDSAVFELDAAGSVVAIKPQGTGQNYVAPGQPSPLLSVRLGGKVYPPDTATWDASRKELKLGYSQGNAQAAVKVDAKPTHVAFEVLSVRPVKEIEVVVWGPYPTTIGDIIGDTIGVVRNAEVAVGLQALNAKTLGGYPNAESDMDEGAGGDDPGRYADLPAELNQGAGFRDSAAKLARFGSSLQAYCRNRDRDRVVSNWGYEAYVAPAFDDGGVIGSRVALFACPAAKTLETMGAIELAEGLPHPLLDGVWAKVSPQANCAYLIVDFSEANIDRAVEMTRRAGLNYLYHSSPFETWGHFRLKPSLFPNGWAGFKSCVEKAAKSGVRVGFHTLSNFITPNDAYVTPKPDTRLAQVGASKLAAAIDAAAEEIEIAAPDYFRKRSPMNTVVIGEELIRYDSVTEQAPWRLQKCKRGAWGTTAAAHATGAPVAKLMDHDYKVFLTDASLCQEVAVNIARFCNETGARQLSLDGLEGAWSTGMGQYGRTLFTKAWYDALAPGLRGQVINDASNPGHFNWHMYTRMNWGEPWYAGFRESQTLYRFKNQLYFERNLMPRMLGWFALRPDTSVEDAEWLLARAAGFDAGFALASSLASTAQLEADPASAETASRFGAVPAILEQIRQWETARMARAFPPQMRAALRDNQREFHLQPAGSGAWDLAEMHTWRFAHKPESGPNTVFKLDVTETEQPLQWVIRAPGKQPVAGLYLQINGKKVAGFGERPLPAGASLKYAGGPEAVICDGSWKELGRIPVDTAAARVDLGSNSVTVGCDPAAGVEVKVELRLFRKPTRVMASGQGAAAPAPGAVSR